MDDVLIYNNAHKICYYTAATKFGDSVISVKANLLFEYRTLHKGYIFMTNGLADLMKIIGLYCPQNLY